jgi:hypothetical protein
MMSLPDPLDSAERWRVLAELAGNVAGTRRGIPLTQREQGAFLLVLKAIMGTPRATRLIV